MKTPILVSIFLITLWCGVDARCRYRGQCITIGGHAKSCPVDIEAQPIVEGLSIEESEEIVDILANRCPAFVYDDEGNRKPNNEILTCCDHVQIRKMTEDLLMAEGVLGRCPSCFRNFARNVCEMNCSPEQSRFVDVYTETAADSTVYVNEIDYRLHERFMLGAHSACSGVIIPQTGLPAINMMCGNVVVCDAEAWFRFMGDTTQNPLAPVQVNYLMWPTEEDSMHVRAIPCNETTGSDLPCSCVDCAEMCPIGDEPVIPEICTVLNVNCISFSVGITFFVISVTIFILLTLSEYRRMRNGQVKSAEPTDVSKFIKFFQVLFAKIGGFSASHPAIIIMLTTWIIFGMFFGAINLNLTSNPIELWSGPESRSRQELNYFNSRFGPFYRAAQVFMQFNGLESFEVDNTTYGPAFRIEAVRELVELEQAIINIGREDGGVTLEEVCFAPLRPRGGEKRLDQCVSMSVSVYLGEDIDNINENTYLSRIQNCLNNYLALNCQAPWGGGAEPLISLGGFDGDNVLDADTLLINFPIANFMLEEDLRPVLEWEQKFIDLMHDYVANKKPDFVDISFGAERSIEDEIRRVSVAEAVPISISYIIMFIYVTVALGNIRNCKTWLIDSKIMVALGSILVVLVSIYCAIGVMGYTNFTTTLLAINVIPFFVLSVGIDNVFLMVNALHDVQSNLKQYDDYNENFSFEKKRRFIFEKMMATVGPSMFVSSVTQITAFAIGSITTFPAVLTFAVFASLSLSFLFIFQITTVVSILSLDYKRASQNRLDVFCCVQKKILDDEDPLNSDTPYQSVTQRLMEPYSKFILNWKVRIVVVIIFMLLVSLSTIFIPSLDIGLDQEMALPKDSYVYKYLVAVSELLRLGPPVYFVLKSGLNFTNPDHQNVICGSQLCYDDSLFTQIFLAAQHSDKTYILRPSNSWIDDFVDWTSLTGICCQYNTTDNTHCPSAILSPDCAFCSISRNEWSNGLRPSVEAFQKYIPFFLQDEPSLSCNRGGLASYSGSVNYELDSEGRATVYDTNFMSYHVALSTSQDFIGAVKNAYEISDSITAAIKKHTDMDVEVFPYSVFYVYFAQYLNMWGDTFASLGYCLIGALAINLLASGFNILTTFAVMFTAIMIVINMMGVMYIWNIPLNPVSCVNLIVSIGIAVEFCSHIAYAFATSKRPSSERVEDAVRKVGSTIITGITLTNMPIVVLAFSYTEVIEVFFFRMFFSLVILGFLHGMIFFPVLLSYLNNLKNK
ncbi:NPC intracellular cholesterol transporter 1 homolog 1b-like [Manduca sexta]|uniref:NPC intracellular cholesterol transporter 1 homolog 1b-like n=1 Tax=Manduca sexta TaxID=7130 RepID=UPI00188DEEBB|nr:NPC intracellular cholesterol transporter 1 homolog 1b-like [Manduca sexta]